jgi:hypothetical protein
VEGLGISSTMIRALQEPVRAFDTLLETGSSVYYGTELIELSFHDKAHAQVALTSKEKAEILLRAAGQKGIEPCS